MTGDVGLRRAGPRAGLAGGLILMVLAGGCADEPEPDPPVQPLVAFDTIDAAIVTSSDTIGLTVELADTDDRRAYGMMERTALSERHGMLFVYPDAQAGENPFWMFRTELPLDIAFVDSAGEIVAIRSMAPCRSPNPDLCRRYAPGVPYSGALEVGEGLLARWGVEIGDRVLPTPDSVAG